VKKEKNKEKGSGGQFLLLSWWHAALLLLLRESRLVAFVFRFSPVVAYHRPRCFAFRRSPLSFFFVSFLRGNVDLSVSYRVVISFKACF
jgi:hypothetical protein